MSANRKRNPNFSQNEKALLINCVFEEKEIIESKKIDGATWKAKENAWNRIEQKFNSQSGVSCNRNSESLKRFYINYKAEIKKAAKDQSSSSTTSDSTIMNPKTVYTRKLENEFDDDSLGEQKESRKLAEHLIKGAKLTNQNDPGLKIPTDDLNFEEETSSDMEKTFATPLVMIEDCINKQFDSSQEFDNIPSTSSGIRPSGASTMQSNKISEQNSELTRIKIELAKLQYETLKEEAIQKRLQANVEHELKRKSLELDVAIKSEVLKKLQKEDCSLKDALSLLKDI